MFLTRLGFGSKIVVTGDITQVDLPGGTRSGLRVVQGILDNVEDISFCHLTNHDVVRHKLGAGSLPHTTGSRLISRRHPPRRRLAPVARDSQDGAR